MKRTLLILIVFAGFALGLTAQERLTLLLGSAA